MKSRLFLLSGAFCLTLIGLSSGCGGVADGDQENAEQLAQGGSPISVQLDKLGDPNWRPVDFHQFTSKWFKYQEVMTSILPPPDHIWSPTLGVAPGAPHEGPYDHELAEGMAASGHIDKSSFTRAEFTHGTYLIWMNVPREETAPLGSSPDSAEGPIIPNEVFPINVTIQHSRNGVLDGAPAVFDVPAPSASPAVDGHSHFPMWTNDSSGSYVKKPGAASYAWKITMVDAGGAGWAIEVPYYVSN
jgi:hypothetical protein